MSDSTRFEWAGWWMCGDGDIFPTREEALKHLTENRFEPFYEKADRVVGRIKQLTDEHDLSTGGWEEVELKESKW